MASVSLLALVPVDFPHMRYHIYEVSVNIVSSAGLDNKARISFRTIEPSQKRMAILLEKKYILANIKNIEHIVFWFFL